MKLSELIHEPPLQIRVEEALKAMDWDFDIDATDDVRMEKGNAALQELHLLMGSLYSREPVLAKIMWEAYCPYAQPGSLPAMLHR